MGSFKSFTRTIPPNPSTRSNISPLSPSDQTSPPLFVPPKPKPTDSAVHVTSWRAPTEWNLSPPSQPSPIYPVSTARSYSPLIPEPSPSLCSSQTGSESWPLETRAVQSPRLQPIHQTLECRPEPPPCTPARSPPPKTPSFGKKPKSLLSPIRDDPSGCLSSDAEAAHPISHSPLEPGLQACSIPYTDTIYQISDAPRRAKAYASLGMMWPRDLKTGWQNWPAAQHADRVAEISQLLQRRKLPPLYPTSPFLDDEFEYEELSDRLQLLSFSQDYHDVLADQYHECRAPRPRSSLMSVASSGLFTCRCILIPKFRLKSQKLISQRLAWRKGSGRQTKHENSTLWTPFRQFGQDGQRPSVDGNVLPCSTGEHTIQHRKRTLNIMSYTKGSRANKRRPGSTDTVDAEKPSHISREMASVSPSQGYRSLLIRFPKGFALVRLSQATSHAEATNSRDVTPHENQRQSSSAVSEYPWRRSSFYNTSPPSSPFPYDIPPLLPVSPARIPESQPVHPSSQASEIWVEEKYDSVLPDEEVRNRGLLNRARDARDAWRRHRRDAKHDKIKQSIKVLGLMDPTVAVGYRKSWGIRSGEGRSD